MKSTDAFELSPSSGEYRQNIIAEIESNLEKVKNQLDSRHESRMSPNEHRKLKGKQRALGQLKVKINSIRENLVYLVDPTNRIATGTPQFLNTNNKFLNAAYCKAMIIRDKPIPSDGNRNSSQERENGKWEAMSDIMTYIELL